MEKKFLISLLGLALGVFAKNLWACPAGQVCSDGSDTCESSLCVADTSGGGSSTAPTTTEGQLGLTLEPVLQLEGKLVRAFHFDASQKDSSNGGWTFYDPRPEFADVNTLTQIAPGGVYWIQVNQATTIQWDSQSAPIPLFEGWNIVPR
ncbi:MAG: hypothetical protein HY466_07325 [Deltaproteobacteria bacterium]|nr:hypothetical protein [Deltaproteobacteria bacterium]